MREMIARTPAERQAYDDRLKAERDEWASTEQAKLEGKIEERTRTVKMLRDLVGDQSRSDAGLADLSLEELVAFETQLRRRLRKCR